MRCIKLAMPLAAKSFLIGSLIMLANACGGGSGSAPPPSVEPDPITLPDSTILPVTTATIGPSTSIVVSFAGAVNISKITISYSGSLSTEMGAPVWATSAFANDTLTIAPASKWIGGVDRILNINFKADNDTTLRSLSVSYTVDADNPGINSISPSTGSGMNSDAEVVINFSESMSPGSLVISGKLWNESVKDSSIWTQTSVPNDTLTLSPDSSAWSGGATTLTFKVNDIAGNALTEQNLNYDVCVGERESCNGLCVNTVNGDVNNCGGCGAVCNSTNVSSRSCGSGECIITACNAGYSDCNANPNDGCETTLGTVNNCNSCGHSCNDNVACTSDSCVGGACSHTANNSVCPSGGPCSAGICLPTGCGMTNLPSGTTCGTTAYGAWSICGGYTTECDQTGTRSRNITAYTCGSAGNCIANTTIQSEGCSRITNGNSCASGTGTCTNGSCIPDNPCSPGQTWCGGVICVTPPKVCP